MEVISAKSILKRSYFESYSEFYLVLAMSKAFYEKGFILNMDGISIDVDSIPMEYIKYYKKLLQGGMIEMSMYNNSNSTVENIISTVEFDTSYFSSVNLAQDNGNTLDWTVEHVCKEYGSKASHFLNLSNLDGGLIHLTGRHLVDVLLGVTTKKLVIHLDVFKSRSTFLYVDIYSCSKTMSWINDYVELDLNLGGYEVDLDYVVLCNNGSVSGRIRHHTVSEKLEYMKKYGMVEGSILMLVSRKGMCENNRYGHITEAVVVRLDEIGDNFLGVTRIPLNKTKEENLQDYYDVDEDTREIFFDMVNKPPHLSSTELDLVGLGIANYFYDEEHFLLTLEDDSAYVHKLITIDDVVTSVYMKQVDAIYWLLCQYELEFDRELFKKMYFPNEVPLWDKYN